MSEVTTLAEEWIREGIEAGWTEDEILARLDGLWNATGHLAGGPGPRASRQAGPMPVRVRRDVVARIRSRPAPLRAERSAGEVVADATSENVRAELERRRSAGQLHGYGELAAHFMVSETTIRRRLGKLK